MGARCLPPFPCRQLLSLIQLTMDSLISFFSLSIFLLQLVGAKNTNSGSLSTINAYWNEIFPSTPMPNAIRALLPSSTDISGFINNYHPKMRSSCPYCSLWGGMGSDHASNISGLSHDSSKLNWSPDLAPLYFLREALQPGSEMNVTMKMSPVTDHASSGDPTFLPRQQAQAIPFSTSNLTAILKMFSIEPDSNLASLTRQTLEDCEAPAIKGEVKHCATSLESMIDFVVAEFGTSEIHAVVTAAVNREEKVKARSYRVGAGGGRMMADKVVTCHSQMFPYTVFYCHSLAGTRAYMVPLVADDGSRVNAIALCHFDTSNWNPGHASFRVLGVKPGTVPICHFILKDLAWVPN